MECNRDEAVRAKEIAEMKIEKQDFNGAKKFVLKAHSLCPTLDGLSQLLATIDVHISAANKVAGEVDWYGLLGISPTADDETVKKQYKKLALMLHPDKNKSPGADGAFKLISDAWNFLADKSKRLAYNKRRFPKGLPQSVSLSTNSPSVPPQTNGIYGYANRPSSTPKACQGNAQVPPTSVPHPPLVPRPPPSVPQAFHQQADTFWTICECKMRYQYIRKYLNQTLLCPHCHKAFIASEAPLPHKSSFSTTCNRPQNVNNHAPAGNSFPAGKNAGSAAKGSGPGLAGVHPSNLAAEPGLAGVHPSNYRNPQSTGVGGTDPIIAARAANGLASEAPLPHKSSFSTTGHRPQNVNNHASAGNSFPAGKNAGSAAKGSGPRLAGVHPSNYRNPQSKGVGGTDPIIAARAANVVQQAQERMKRTHDALHTAAGGKGNSGNNSTPTGERLYKKARFDEDGHKYGANASHDRTFADVHSSLSNTTATRKSGFQPGFPGLYHKPNGIRELTPLETRNMLMEKARKVILEKLYEQRSHTRTKYVNRNKLNVNERKKGKEQRRAMIDQEQDSKKGSDDSSDILRVDQVEKTAPVVIEDPVAESMDVPDSDFHDFDQNRTESCFGESEVWAAYDDVDGMPRFYAMINKVISRKPFKLKIGWLNSKTNSEFGSVDWVGAGFLKACGEFRVGKYETNKFINCFSHKVQWSKGQRGVVRIFPKKGEVWALYRHWAPDWNEETPEEVTHKYDMVVVLEDYLEEQGVSVAPLVKVIGFKTVFRPHSDPEKVMRIPKEEMFRFSHQVPHYRFTGEEAQTAPKGCVELDPAATPQELLEVSTDSSDTNAKEEALHNFLEVNGDKIDGTTKIEAKDC